MNNREVWDAVNADGELLGYDLFRDEAERIPHGVYHIVPEVITITDKGRILLTQRDPAKPYGCKWEFTCGSALKGESALQAAARELQEETGIYAENHQFHALKCLTLRNSLYYIYLCKVKEEGLQIYLQPGETVDHRFITAAELPLVVRNDSFAEPVRERFEIYADSLFACINAINDG